MCCSKYLSEKVVLRRIKGAFGGKTRPCWQICANLVSQLSHAEGCSILYHRWINILRKPFMSCESQSQVDTRTVTALLLQQWADQSPLARWIWETPLSSFKQSLSGGCPTIDVCYHTDINGKQQYKIVIITITIIIWSKTDPAVSV